jgi:hypothetical protein
MGRVNVLRDIGSEIKQTNYGEQSEEPLAEEKRPEMMTHRRPRDDCNTTPVQGSGVTTGA